MMVLSVRAVLIGTASVLAAVAALPATAQTTGTPPGTGQDAGNPTPQNPVPVGGPAAQQAAAPDGAGDDDVIVTGSRIARRNLQSGQPTITIDSAYIDQRGFSNVADALNTLPSFGVPGSSRIGGQAGAFGSGQSFINFFGLGDQRTLVLVNGRRFITSNSSSIFGPTGAGIQVDLNAIPTLLIDRVDTIAVGGAPIYGSDAVAGTVNIITKRRFNGLVVDGQYGVSERGDATDARVRALVGRNFAGGRGNITFAAEYNEQGGLTIEDRPEARLNSFFTAPLPGSSTFGNIYIPNRRIPSLSPFGVPLVTDFIPLDPAQAQNFGFQPSVTNAAGQPLGFDASGNLVPIDFGQRTGSLINFNGGNGFVLPGNLLSPVKRYLFTGLADYDVSDKVRVFVEGWYANSRGEQLRDQPVYNTALFDAAGTPDGNIILSVDNPYLSAAARQTILQSLATNPAADAPAGRFYLGRANTDLVSGAGSSTVELYRFVAGTEARFNALGRDLKLQVTGNYGRSTTQGETRVLVQQNFENAINAVRDASGNIVCAPGYTNAAIRTLSSTCAPINPFGQQISQAARDYVTAVADPRQVNEQWVVNAALTGNLFNVWGGPVGFALGYEHRNESASFNPGAFYFGQPDPNNPGQRTQFGRSIPIDPVRGAFNTDEAFAELNVPLIGRDQNIPLIRSLELHGAARYIDNSFAGGDWTYTGDARWEVLPGITFRGNYTRSVRAPAITELTNPTSQIFTTANDPCDVRFINAGPNPARRAANCAAAGLPAQFNSNIVEFTTRGSLAGNPNLRNELADAYVLGAIVRPGWLPRLNLSVDWVDIRLKNAITSLNATQVLQGCYDAPTFPNTLCGNFTRDAAGQISFIQTGFANAATQNFRGLIVDLGYSIPTPFLGDHARIAFQGNYQYTDELVLRVGQGDRTTLRNAIGYSPHKANANLYYTVPGFTWAWQWQYFGPTRVDPDEPANNRDFPNVGSVSFFNTTLAADVAKSFTLRLVINNLFDARTPFPTPAGGGTTTYFDGILGRNFRISATARF